MDPFCGAEFEAGRFLTCTLQQLICITSILLIYCMAQKESPTYNPLLFLYVNLGKFLTNDCDGRVGG